MNSSFSLNSDGGPEGSKSSVDLDIIIGAFDGVGPLRRRTCRSPNAIVCCVRYANIGLDGLVVHCRRDVFQVLVALLARRGFVVTKADLIEHLYGDREDGGPSCPLHGAMKRQLRETAGIFGFDIENWYGVGYVARQRVDVPMLQAAE